MVHDYKSLCNVLYIFPVHRKNIIVFFSYVIEHVSVSFSYEERNLYKSTNKVAAKFKYCHISLTHMSEILVQEI